MLTELHLRGAIGFTVALVLIGLAGLSSPVRAAAPAEGAATPKACLKIDNSNYAYCCRIRLEAACSALSVKPEQAIMPEFRLFTDWGSGPADQPAHIGARRSRVVRALR